MSNSPLAQVRNWIAAGIALLFLSVIFFNVVVDNMPKGEERTIEGYTPWSDEVLKIAETIPIQSDGRVKPLATYAGFKMLGLHGARSMKVEGKDKKIYQIKPTAWMMDTLFRPQYAIKLPTFRIDNSEVIEAVGLKTRKKRDRYSYEDINPAREKLIELAKSYEGIEKDKRDPVQEQVILLAYNFREYESLLAYFGFARAGVTLTGSGEEGASDKRVALSLLLSTAPQIREQIEMAQSQGSGLPKHLQALLEQVLDAANFSKYGLTILPPQDAKQELWQSAGNSIMEVMTKKEVDPTRGIADIKALESVAVVSPDDLLFLKNLTALRDDLKQRADARGEYKNIEREAKYYRSNGFLHAMIWYLIGTVTALAMWGLGKNIFGRICGWLTIICSGAGLIYSLMAIVQRCIIMERPPVGNLYDTIIFIATTVVILGLVVELLTRRGFALGLTPILGAALVVLARRYELGEAVDHMNPLVAVLISNYWLTVHVPIVTLGYTAGLLSAFLSFIYILMRGLNLDNENKELRRAMTRSVYGMICFTLFLSLFGTVAGGIWANDSWGRFWGWDPKENGALMIVLWTLSILHARLGGYIREWGLHLASVFTAIVVTFSWWHVNFLGVGLHNYGFTAGAGTIWAFYATISVALVFGVIAMLFEKHRKANPSPSVNILDSTKKAHG